jgi:hypothetical protein
MSNLINNPTNEALARGFIAVLENPDASSDDKKTAREMLMIWAMEADNTWEDEREEYKTPTNKYEALTLALELAITAKTKDGSFRAESMAKEFASSLDESEVERAKLEVNAKLFPEGQGNGQNIPA